MTAARGGLNGYILTGPDRPTLHGGGQRGRRDLAGRDLPPHPPARRAARPDPHRPSATATTITALAPVDEAPEPEPEPELPIGGAFTVGTDAEGFQTIEGAAISTDAEGFQTIENGTATADAEGFETVERTTP
ncbi:hypothetical protein [Deinococcus sp. YIM 77859]|uniref:hypothetical protein n=1 Tax=Deinococcus sp. YIM 77859 TaxID=1540221 RepID=UPI000AD6F8CA|nr:hypothetical protein [Deinococcus sp. YIM 77859]